MPHGARWCHMVPQVARRCGTAVAARLARLETTPRGLLETRSTYRSESKATERVERRRGLGPNTTRTHRPKCGQRPCHPGLAKCRHQPTPAGAFSDLGSVVSQQQRARHQASLERKQQQNARVPSVNPARSESARDTHPHHPYAGAGARWHHTTITPQSDRNYTNQKARPW